MGKNKLNPLAFTLIEILVIVTIITIVTGIGLAYYNDDNHRKNLFKEQRKLVDVLSLARKKTMANDDQNHSCTDFQGYQVNVVNANSYSMTLCCDASCIGIQTYNLISDVVFQTITTSLQFKPITLNVNPAETFTLRNSALSNKCVQVTVSSAGVISTSDIISCP